jgi:hypothetical protein
MLPHPWNHLEPDLICSPPWELLPRIRIHHRGLLQRGDGQPQTQQLCHRCSTPRTKVAKVSQCLSKRKKNMVGDLGMLGSRFLEVPANIEPCIALHSLAAGGFHQEQMLRAVSTGAARWLGHSLQAVCLEGGRLCPALRWHYFPHVARGMSIPDRWCNGSQQLLNYKPYKGLQAL